MMSALLTGSAKALLAATWIAALALAARRARA